jgi:hypothetical protein
MASLFRGGRSNELANEMTSTMSVLLEDTLLKNIQLKVVPPPFALPNRLTRLQEDLEVLGEDVVHLGEENKRLRKELETIKQVESTTESG